MHVVLANEMGGGWGHLLPLRSIAHEFVQCGCQVSLLCRDRERADAAFRRMDVAIEQSPEWEPNKTGFSLNYAQNLWGNGYWNADLFTEHLKWWSDRFRVLKPGFVLTNYAPTALLAAMSLHIPRGAFGPGFYLPPIASPWPSFHPWLNIPDDALKQAEEKLLSTIRRHFPSIHSSAAIFQDSHRFLTVFPEINHFGASTAEHYLGPILETHAGGDVAWPEGRGPKVLIYLSSANRLLSDLLAHISQLGCPAVGYIRGLSETERRALASPTLRLSDDLINLDRALSECQIVVTQGGLHTTSAGLLAGVRLLVCPEQLEQTMLAYRLKQQGLCEFVSLFSEGDKVSERFDQVVSSAHLKNNAAAFASRYAGYDSSATVRKMVKTCLNTA